MTEQLSWLTHGFHILTDFCLLKLRLMSTLQPLSRFGNAAMECQFWLIFPLIWSSVWYWFLLYFVFIKCITIDLSSLLKHITAFAMVHSSVYWRRLKDWQEFFDWQQWLSLWAELSTAEKFSSKYIWWEFSITSVSSCPSNDQKIQLYLFKMSEIWSLK